MLIKFVAKIKLMIKVMSWLAFDGGYFLQHSHGAEKKKYVVSNELMSRTAPKKTAKFSGYLLTIRH